jgi:hypothetical protein
MADTTATDDAEAPVLTELTPDQEKELIDFAAKWPQVARVKPANRTKVEEALSRLYKSVEVDAPPVIWCEGPWHLVAIKVLMKLNALRDSEPSELIDTVIAKLVEIPEWQKVWQQLNALVQEKNLSCDFGDDERAFLTQGSLSQEITLKVSKSTSKAKEQLSTLLSLPIKLQLRRAFREVNEDRENARLRLAARNRQIVVTQFGLVSISLFLANRMPGEFTQHLTPEARAELTALCEKKWPATHGVRGQLLKTDPLDKLFSSMNERLNSFNDVFDLQPVAFFVQHMPELLPSEVIEPIKDWLTLKEKTFHIELRDKMCFVCECPDTALLNDRHQLHNETGPAMTFRDGCEVFAWNGVVLPSAAVMATDQLTIEQIDKEQNVEVRRILIQQYGMEKYLKDSNAVKIDEDEYGVLYRKSQPLDEPIVVVRVLNPTPEPDGTNKFYFLRVAPYITTARQAVAWTFDMDEQDYQPAKQS